MFRLLEKRTQMRLTADNPEGMFAFAFLLRRRCKKRAGGSRGTEKGEGEGTGEERKKERADARGPSRGDNLSHKTGVDINTPLNR